MLAAEKYGKIIKQKIMHQKMNVEKMYFVLSCAKGSSKSTFPDFAQRFIMNKKTYKCSLFSKYLCLFLILSPYEIFMQLVSMESL